MIHKLPARRGSFTVLIGHSPGIVIIHRELTQNDFIMALIDFIFYRVQCYVDLLLTEFIEINF